MVAGGTDLADIPVIRAGPAWRCESDFIFPPKHQETKVFDRNRTLSVRNPGIISQRISPELHLRAVTSLTHRSHGARILVVDDNAVLRRALRNLLETQDDWKVCDEASDGLEAIAKFDKGKFDVIVIDFQMPVMNGLDAAKQITSRSPTTPILMVTLHHSPQLAEEARKVGIRGICPKADIECVVEGVTTILDNRSYFKN